MDEKWRQLKEWIGGSDNIVFLDGAGVSMESGILDFYSMNGPYNQQYKYPPETIISYSFYMRYLEELYRFYKDRMLFTDAVPNQAHKALAWLEKRGKLKTIVTQNTDDLHQVAGGREVLGLHGNVHRNYCTRRGQFYDLDYVIRSDGVPHYSCGGVIKSDVVLYGERLDNRTLQKLVDHIRHANMLVIGGIPLVAYPVTGLIDYYRGHKLVLIDRAAISRDSQMDLVISDPIGEVLGIVADQERKISQMYQTVESRYGSVEHKRSGRGGVLFPRISPGLWQDFRLGKSLGEQEAVFFRAFDMGTTHSDLADSHGLPAVGGAKENPGPALRDGLGRYEGELFISTKVGFDLWPGPYGNWGSRKYLVAGLDLSLRRMGPEHADAFHYHRSNPETPLEKIMGVLSDMAHQGKVLYVGIFNYRTEEAGVAICMLREDKTPCLLHQPWHNMSERWAEDGLSKLPDRKGMGCIRYSPLAQGVLTGRYLGEIPEEPRVSKEGTTMGGRYLTEDKLVKTRALDEMAGERGQSLAQTALA